MKKAFLTVSLLIALTALVGCTGSLTQTQRQQAKVQRMTVVNSGKPDDVLPAFISFTWDEQYNRILSAVNSDNENEVKDYIRSEMIAYLQTKGYQYQPDPQEADLVIGFLFALDDALADNKIQAKFGLVPGINRKAMGDPRYKKGTFILTLLDTQLETVYWRSAMQGFVDLETEKKNQNPDQIQKVLDLMMGGFPAAGR